MVFLHRDERPASETKVRMLAEVREHDPRLAGRHILIVDDDARNIFALTSALESCQLEITYAENGRVALNASRHPRH